MAPPRTAAAAAPSTTGRDRWRRSGDCGRLSLIASTGGRAAVYQGEVRARAGTGRSSRERDRDRWAGDRTVGGDIEREMDGIGVVEGPGRGHRHEEVRWRAADRTAGDDRD